MRSVLVGFGLGFFVALQLGPMSLFLIRSTLRAGLLTGLGVGAGIAVVDALYAAAGAAWVCALALLTAVVRRHVGSGAVRAADGVAGLGLVGFGAVLGWRSL